MQYINYGKYIQCIFLTKTITEGKVKRYFSFTMGNKAEQDLHYKMAKLYLVMTEDTTKCCPVAVP